MRYGRTLRRLVAERGFESIESKVGAAGRGQPRMSDPREPEALRRKSPETGERVLNEPMHETFSEMFEQELANSYAFVRHDPDGY